LLDYRILFTLGQINNAGPRDNIYYIIGTILLTQSWTKLKFKNVKLDLLVPCVQGEDISTSHNISHIKSLGDWFDASVRQQSESCPDAGGPEKRLNEQEGPKGPRSLT